MAQEISSFLFHRHAEAERSKIYQTTNATTRTFTLKSAEMQIPKNAHALDKSNAVVMATFAVVVDAKAAAAAAIITSY